MFLTTFANDFDFIRRNPNLLMSFAKRSFSITFVGIARTARNAPGIAVMYPRRSVLEQDLSSADQ